VQPKQDSLATKVDDDKVFLESLASSKVSGSCDEDAQRKTLLKSKVVSVEAMEKYIKVEEKMRKEIANVSLEDHSWAIKTFD